MLIINSALQIEKKSRANEGRHVLRPYFSWGRLAGKLSLPPIHNVIGVTAMEVSAPGIGRLPIVLEPDLARWADDLARHADADHVAWNILADEGHRAHEGSFAYCDARQYHRSGRDHGVAFQGYAF